MTDEKKPTGPFRAEDFDGIDMSDRAGKTTRTRFGPSPRQAGNIAEAINGRIARLWDALEQYEHSAQEEFMRRLCGDEVLAAYRALRDSTSIPWDEAKKQLGLDKT